jgi:predicted HicB family RNase H-like nuclease
MIPNAHVSDRNYSTLRQVVSLDGLADFTTATVEGMRIEGKVAIPEFVTFKKFPARETRFEVEPTETVRMKYSEYKKLRDAHSASETVSTSVDELISMAESYL